MHCEELEGLILRGKENSQKTGFLCAAAAIIWVWKGETPQSPKPRVSEDTASTIVRTMQILS